MDLQAVAKLWVESDEQRARNVSEIWNRGPYNINEIVRMKDDVTAMNTHQLARLLNTPSGNSLVKVVRYPRLYLKPTGVK